MSVTKGSAFEELVYEYFKSLIESDNFLAKKECCKIYRQKGYYSKDRESEIKFDVSIELFLPGATEYSVLILIECKDYTGAIPAGEIQKFAEDRRQVGSGNAKGIIASTAPFQSSALSYAKAQRLGLLRYFQAAEFKWELLRSPSVSAISGTPVGSIILKALRDEVFPNPIFDFYSQTPTRLTSSIYDLFLDLCSESESTRKALSRMANPRQVPNVPYRDKEQIENYSTRILKKVGYEGGYVELDAIGLLETNRYGLKISLSVSRGDSIPKEILGRIDFDKKTIDVYADDDADYARPRFTLAHELSHSLLNHGKYMVHEVCDENDFASLITNMPVVDIQRMEFQANYLASCLLMPREEIINSLSETLSVLGVRRRTAFPLYVDNQPWNLDIFREVSGRLTNRYRVSEQALCIRLSELKQLKDDRLKNVVHVRSLFRAPYRLRN